MRFRLPRRLLVVVLVALLVVLASSTVAWALSNGPETSSLNKVDPIIKTARGLN